MGELLARFYWMTETSILHKSKRAWPGITRNISASRRRKTANFMRVPKMKPAMRAEVYGQMPIQSSRVSFAKSRSVSEKARSELHHRGGLERRQARNLYSTRLLKMISPKKGNRISP